MSGFDVSVLTRSRSQKSEHPETRLIETDYSPESLATALTGQDAIVCAIGPLGTMIQPKLIDAAVAAKVKRFIPSDYGWDTPNIAKNGMETQLPQLYMRLKPKATILEYLASKAVENPGFTWTAIGAGPLFDWVIRLAEADVKNEC